MRTRSSLAVLAALALVVTAAGSAAAAQDVPEGAIPLGGGNYAVELKKATPSWYTQALHKRVVAAGRRGESVPLPESADVPQSALAFTGIRPGAWMLSPSWCTLNFVFGAETHIGTAGHCASGGDEVTIVAAPGVLMNIGTTVRSVDGGIGNDFALIEIYPAMQQYVNPSMAIVGGPTATKAPQLGDAIVHVGHGLAIGTGGTARPGVVTYPNFPVVADAFGQNRNDADAFGWNGAVSPGDSGSGARAVTGEAVGNVTHLVIGTDFVPSTFVGTTIQRMQAIAGRSVATASLVPDPLP
ncbi:MAG: hypothetical protein ACRDJ5_05600 [Actinomycetota bacterium]